MKVSPDLIESQMSATKQPIAQTTTDDVDDEDTLSENSRELASAKSGQGLVPKAAQSNLGERKGSRFDLMKDEAAAQ